VHRIIGIGEILWDIFPDGPRFGGAPANYACSAAALAKTSAHVSMVSAVGEDDLGRQAIECLREREVDTSTVQANEHATGQVNVELDRDGVATYRFDERSAWDFLEWRDSMQEIAAGCDAICFGSLGQRSKVARATIREFVNATPQSAFRIFDVNLRAPYFSDDVLIESLAIANVLKLNDDELPVIARLSDVRGTDVEVMQQLADKYQLRAVALTRGAEGAAIFADHQVSDQPGTPVDVVDTVGAGDAFTAAMTLGLLKGHPIDRVNENAIATASFVCSKPGATMPLPSELG
jgi:fructokinase